MKREYPQSRMKRMVSNVVYLEAREELNEEAMVIKSMLTSKEALVMNDALSPLSMTCVR